MDLRNLNIGRRAGLGFAVLTLITRRTRTSEEAPLVAGPCSAY